MSRSRIVKFRVTDEEYEALVLMAKEFGLTKSDVIRQLVFQKRDHLMKWKEFIEPYKQLSFDSRNITNNINQIAKYTNYFNKKGTGEPSIVPIMDLNALLSKYVTLQRQVEELLLKFLKK